MTRTRIFLAALLAFVLAACGANRSVEACWEDAVNRPSAEGGCQGLTHPEAIDLCLAHAYDYCEQTGA